MTAPLRDVPTTATTAAAPAPASDSVAAFGWAISRETAGQVYDTWALHDHPVLQRIREGQHRGIVYRPRTGECFFAGPGVQQTITLEEAHALRDHFDQVAHTLREHFTTTESEEITAGAYLGTIYGVRILVENPAPLVAETRGGAGETNPRTVIESLAPAGTRVEVETMKYEVVTADIAADTLQLVKRALGQEAGKPHVLADLDPQHLYVQGEGLDIDHFRELFPEGSRMLWIGTLCAVPGQTTHIVIRAAPSLEAASCWVAGDWDGRWIERAQSDRCRVVPVVHEEIRKTEEGDAGTGTEAGEARMLSLRNGLTRETGRVEIGPDGEVGEVYEVYEAPDPTYPYYEMTAP